MREMYAVGIDLGTTYSAASYVDRNGTTVMIPGETGDFLTPSAVLFADDEILIGTDAKKAAVLQPDRYADCAKRDMGSLTYSKTIAGMQLPPEVIQAFVLQKLRCDIERKVGNQTSVVISVPAFFDESRRRATASAAYIAGIELMDIINEPTAGALAVGEHLGILGNDETKRNLIFVYDLGGGTFDATLMEMSSRNFRTIATDGDVRLGGRDWDLRLVDIVSERFIQKHREDPRTNVTSFQRLLREAEYAKHTLSLRKLARVRVDHAGVFEEIEVSRQDFEDATEDLLERTAYTVRQLLSTSNVQACRLSQVILVGGASRMPMVSQMLEKELGLRPMAPVNPDEANARGAALYAKYRLRGSFGDSAEPACVTNVNAHSLGIQGSQRDTDRDVNAILIPRNTPLPARVTREFATKHDNQPSISVRVLEGESTSPSETTMIGNAVVRNLPANLKKQHPIDITYEYTTSGRLKVSAHVKGTECSATVELERISALPEQTFDRWRSVVTSPFPHIGEVRTTATECLTKRDAPADDWVITNEVDEAHAEKSSPRHRTSSDSGAVEAVERTNQDDETFLSECLEDVDKHDQTTKDETGQDIGENEFAQNDEPQEQETRQETVRSEPLVTDQRTSQTFVATEGTVGGLGKGKVPWFVHLFGHVLFSLAGLAIGYYLIHCWFPNRFPLPELVQSWMPWLR